jgi:hypothetical protein
MFAALLGLSRPGCAFAQNTQLRVAGFPVSFPVVTGAHFAAGFVDASNTTTFTVNAHGSLSTRIASVSLRCNSPCPANGGPKPLATLKWRRADLPTWNTLTTSNVEVEKRTMILAGTNDPWSNQILWRFNLDWLNDPPGAATTFNVVFTLTVTLP